MFSASTLLIGEVSWLFDIFPIQYICDVIYLISMALSPIFYLVSARQVALSTIQWRDLVIRSRYQID